MFFIRRIQVNQAKGKKLLCKQNLPLPRKKNVFHNFRALHGQLVFFHRAFCFDKNQIKIVYGVFLKVYFIKKPVSNFFFYKRLSLSFCDTAVFRIRLSRQLLTVLHEKVSKMDPFLVFGTLLFKKFAKRHLFKSLLSALFTFQIRPDSPLSINIRNNNNNKG